MPRIEMSAGARLTLTFAAIEARESRHATITPNHLLGGLANMEKFTRRGAFAEVGLPSTLEPEALSETQPFVAALQALKFDPKFARRRMRALMGRGQSDGATEPEIDAASESILQRAAEFAAKRGDKMITVFSLMAAVLDAKLDHLPQLLEEMKVDADVLRDKLLELHPRPLSNTPLLDEIGEDLTAKAREGKLDEAIGRKREMERLQQVLGRKDKNAPVLIGEAGVGKTAVVEGYAYRIAKHPEKTHPAFRDKRIIQINAADLVAGTGLRGDFEKRMTQLIEEAKNAPEVILFIDEIHLLVGAGTGSQSAMDAANIFKPALGRSLIKLIGATTEGEYRRYIEKDSALERRFEPIRVEEPDRESAYQILDGIAKRLEAFHQVTVSPEAVHWAVDLSIRYLTSRRLPDKAKDLLDDACAEMKYGALSYSPNMAVEEDAALNTVTKADVSRVVARKMGLPVGIIDDDIKNRVNQLEAFLTGRVVGQQEAVQAVSRVIRRHYAGMSPEQKPLGVFLFAGPTGVGKTELAKAVAAFLFHSERNLIRIDLSEYSEKHTVSRLIGAPPGYVGYEDGGVLTNALRTTPYAVVLLDEVEKADTQVMNVFLQAFDEGRLTDALSRKIDAQNVIFIMTSNLGYGASMGFAATPPTHASVEGAIRSHFAPEFVGRVAIVHFNALRAEDMVDVVKIQFARLNERLAQREISVQPSEAAIQWLAEHSYDPQMGARGLLSLFNQKVIDPIGGMLLNGDLDDGEMVQVNAQNDDIQVNRAPAVRTQNPAMKRDQEE